MARVSVILPFPYLQEDDSVVCRGMEEKIVFFLPFPFFTLFLCMGQSLPLNVAYLLNLEAIQFVPTHTSKFMLYFYLSMSALPNSKVSVLLYTTSCIIMQRRLGVTPCMMQPNE